MNQRVIIVYSYLWDQLVVIDPFSVINVDDDFYIALISNQLLIFSSFL
jgi:predicted glycosyltransferase involved in capsule biosynthesis